jgi:hypothetical protein
VSETPDWETPADIDKEAKAKGFAPPSLDQLERWRGRHLLKPAKQTSDYRGSVVEFPAGTAKQTIRLMELLRIKEKFEYVGWELWWVGYDVGEEWWKPMLQDAAGTGDAALRRVRRVFARSSSGGSDDDDETEFDKIEREAPAAALGSQIARRLKVGQTATYLRILSEVASGKFSGFDDDVKKGDGSDYDIAVRGLDLERSGEYPGGARDQQAATSDHILGRDLNFVSALGDVLSDMTRVFRTRSLSDALSLPIEEVRAVRNDVRGALKIGTDLYEMGAWIFGPGAFGLRIMPWLARRSASQRALLILGFALLRRSKHPFLTSAQIAVLAEQAEHAKSDLAQLRRLAEKSPRLGSVITAKAVRRAFRSPDEFQRFKERLTAASMK